MRATLPADGMPEAAGQSPVVLAKTAGFCFGVKRAVDTVYEQIEQSKTKPEGKKIYTFGPIIHNAEVVKDLEEKGVSVIEDEADLAGIAGQILIIRSHGVARHIYEMAHDYGITVIDATCPFVKKIHEIADKESKEGRQVLIVGNPSHPEVQGIMGWVHGEALVVKNEEDALRISIREDLPVTVVAQTTFHSKKFNNIVEIIQKKGYHIRVINTICNATRLRQEEAESFSKQADVMLVIGDRRSSNTQKLFDICRSYCKDTYYIQTVKDLDRQEVAKALVDAFTKASAAEGAAEKESSATGAKTMETAKTTETAEATPAAEDANVTDHDLRSGIIVGITAGASTPNNIIQEVFLTCQKKKISTR